MLLHILTASCCLYLNYIPIFFFCQDDMQDFHLLFTKLLLKSVFNGKHNSSTLKGALNLTARPYFRLIVSVQNQQLRACTAGR